ncbi:MAG TPA: hypothetical protein VKU00_22245 [Chthonomonadaceae bacterium]|nr:hypothetical protein [Chthonomonadaceae bacterium]
MKQLLSLIALALVIPTVGFAQSTPKTAIPQKAVHTIQVNADAVVHNAHIYQWERVNLEVDRIVAAEKQVQKALTSDSTHAAEAKELSQTVKELRSARLNRDVDRLEKVGAELSKLADKLQH